MGGKRKTDQAERARILQEQAEAQKVLDRKKAKQSLIIRSCIAAAVLAAAVVVCLMMLRHDFNPDRDVLHGTYIAERRFVYETGSSTDLSNARIFPVVFCEDGQMLYKYDTGTQIHYYEFKEYDGTEGYDGIISQYTDGVFAQDINITRDENGNISMTYIYDSPKFTVPKLVRYFGEELTLSMLMGVYDEEICRLLIAQDYDSLTDEQVKKMNVDRENIPAIAFTIKNLPAVFSLVRISDDELSRTEAMAIWTEMNSVSDSGAVSDSDAE